MENPAQHQMKFAGNGLGPSGEMPLTKTAKATPYTPSIADSARILL
jgi:hypothetical protein